MTSWADVAAAEPELAAAVRARLEAHTHLYLATLRKDGSPRISGIELTIRDGELWLGSMPGARKFADLRHDPRLALHSGSDDPDPADPTGWTGDAKISGRAVEVTDPEQIAIASGGDPAHAGIELMRIDVTDVVHVHLGDPPDHLVVDHWRPGAPVRRTERR
jgi:hypothetical protein